MMTKEQDEIPKKDENIEEIDLSQYIKRKIPICVGGTFISSIEIIEASKDLLVAEKPELLQIDLKKPAIPGEWDKLALLCIMTLINKNNLQEKLVAYDTADLSVNDNPGFIFLGMPILLKESVGSKIDHLMKTMEYIKSMGIILKSNRGHNDNEDEDSQEESEHYIEHEFDDKISNQVIMMGFIIDIFFFLDKRNGEMDINESDLAFDAGFDHGSKANYDEIQIALFKLNTKSKFTKQFDNFLDDLHNICEGFDEDEYSRWIKKFDKYMKTQKAKEEKEDIDEKA